MKCIQYRRIAQVPSCFRLQGNTLQTEGQGDARVFPPSPHSTSSSIHKNAKNCSKINKSVKRHVMFFPITQFLIEKFTNLV